MTVLVAGATDMLGHEVAKLLREKGYRVKTFSRNPARAQALRGIAHEIATGDATKPKSLDDVFDGVDAVISCLGAPMGFTGKDRRSFHKVDTVANCNLVQAANKAGVSRFVYVSVHVQPGYARTAYIRAHEEVIQELRKSGISFGVVRPTGTFPIFDPFLHMARRGIIYIPGNGKALTNPVHPLDVAETCVETLTLGNDVSVSIGGPDILSREEIARIAFKTVGKKPKILHIPRYVLLATAAMVQPLHPRYGEVLEFVARVFTSECVAPTRGRRRLSEHFAKVASMAA
ncbi:MAG: SDR family oxidoreductase [Deltaproteobacteria bacterium]|nr:SDR family oxidoreductase [Deltaproteobacteria bacterium]